VGDTASHDAQEITQALEEALKLLSDTQTHYQQATPHTRRLLNQALFKKLLIRDDLVSGAEQTPWVAAARAGPVPHQDRKNGPEQPQDGRRTP
jgi:hypothetical protein